MSDIYTEAPRWFKLDEAATRRILGLIKNAWDSHHRARGIVEPAPTALRGRSTPAPAGSTISG